MKNRTILIAILVVACLNLVMLRNNVTHQIRNDLTIDDRLEQLSAELKEDLKAQLKEEIKNYTFLAMDFDARTIDRGRDRLALEETVKLVEDELTACRTFDDRESLIRFAFSQIDPALDGLVAEFGPAPALSTNLLASLSSKTIYSFDPGLVPPPIKGLKPAPNIELRKGAYKEMLPEFGKQAGAPLALAHINIGNYEISKIALDSMNDWLVKGSVVVIDKYFNYPGWQLADFKALREWAKRNEIKVEYLGYNRYGQSLALRIAAGQAFKGRSRGKSDQLAPALKRSVAPG